MKKRLKIILILLFILQIFPGQQRNLFAQIESGSVSMGTFEDEVLKEINLFRSDPKAYAEDKLTPLLQQYQGRLLTFKGETPLQTQEGIKPLEECIAQLHSIKPLPLLKSSTTLTKAANDLAHEQHKTGATGHYGKKGSSPKSRIEKYGKWQETIAENIAYGAHTPFMVVALLLIDDGVPNRGHRMNFLNPKFKRIGIAFGKHPTYRTVCVMDFAGTIDQ